MNAASFDAIMPFAVVNRFFDRGVVHQDSPRSPVCAMMAVVTLPVAVFYRLHIDVQPIASCRRTDADSMAELFGCEVNMLGATLDSVEHLERLRSALSRIDQKAMRSWADLIYQAWEDDRFVYIMGNGGSGTTTSHFSEDLGKCTLRPDDLSDESKKRLKVLSLTDNAGWIMAVGNDLSYDQIFVQQLINYGQTGGLVIAISGSGNSPIVLHAVDWANRNRLITFGLTGYQGGELKRRQQHGLHVDLNDMGMVESIHFSLFHWVLNDVYTRINIEGRCQGS